MANPEQLVILRQGVAAWNAWRKENPDIKIDLSEAQLEGEHLEGINLEGANLDRAVLSNTWLTGANLIAASMKQAQLWHARLEHSNMAHAELREAKLAFAELDRAKLPYADFQDADLSSALLRYAFAEDADFERANLIFVDFEKAHLAFSNFKDANMAHAQFTGASLIAANLENANVYDAKFNHRVFWSVLGESGLNFNSFWKRRLDLFLDTTMRCRGINAASCYGSQKFKIFLEDQDYLEELMGTPRGRRAGVVWWLFANCGRSIYRWIFWSALFVIIFSGVFRMLDPSSFHTQQLGYSYLTFLYYSIVTFTTLGFGDVVPKTHEAALWVSLEVITGYVMLGGLISIFANKLARRSR